MMGLILVQYFIKSRGRQCLKKVMIVIDDYLYQFYKKVGENGGGMNPEQVMADTLFKLAGELSLNALNTKDQILKKT